MKQTIQTIRHFAMSQPEAVAIQSGSQSLSYAELLADVEDVAQLLLEQRVQSLAIYLDNSIEWIVIDLACQLAQVSVVPLPWFFSRDQRQHACRDAGVDWVVAEETLPPDIEGCSPGRLFYRASMVYPVNTPGLAPGKSLTGSKISYTSGTTGQPRGIQLCPQLIEQTALSISQLMRPMAIEKHLSVLPYSTLLENIAGVYVPLLLGKTICAEPAHRIGLTPDLKLDAAQFARIISETRGGSLVLTPQLLEALCVLTENGLSDPQHLRFVAVGGARVATDLLQRAEQAGIPAYEGYGLTEFASVALLNTPQFRRIGSAGKPLPGIELTIADDGEIILRRKLASSGQQMTEVRVATGDIGHVDDDGFVYVAGRKSNLIVLSTGRNVSPEWIETELNNSALIQQSFVYGEAQAQLSALIHADASVSDAAIQFDIERINRQLPPYAHITDWQRLQRPFSAADSTLTANGRLRRPIIQAQLGQLIDPQPRSPSASNSLQETCSC